LSIMGLRLRTSMKRNNKILLRTVLLTVASILAFVLASPASVWALAGDTDGVFGVDGRLRTFGGLVDYSKLPSFLKDQDTESLFQTSLRLMADGRAWKRLSYEVHVVQTLNLASASAGGLFLDSGSNRYQALDGTWEQYNEGDISANLALDRFNVKLSFPWADLTVGRQAITFGKAYFWNPLDVFLPFAAEQYERDYKTGVDAVRLDLPIGNFSGVSLIGVLGREIALSGRFVNEHESWDSSWYGSALLFRAYTNVADWDLAIQSGKIYGGYQLGGGAVGEIGLLEFRFEAAYFTPEGESASLPFPFQGQLLEDHWAAVLGVGHRFENTLTLEFEYLYNGAGDSDNLEASLLRLAQGSTLHMGTHLTGALVSYDIIPILNVQAVWIYSFSDQSSLLQPVFTLSLSDEAELLFGASFSVGSRPFKEGFIPRLQSEFGSYPDIYFIELKYYF